MVSAKIQTVIPNLSRVYAELKAKVGTSGVVMVLTYPQILPPSSSATCGGVPFIPSDVDWLKAKTHEFDQAIISTAQAAGVSVQDEENAFTGHLLCSSQPYSNPVYLPIPPWNHYSLHPNSLGYGKEASDLEARLGW
jgi:hypothetical protein